MEYTNGAASGVMTPGLDPASCTDALRRTGLPVTPVADLAALDAAGHGGEEALLVLMPPLSNDAATVRVFRELSSNQSRTGLILFDRHDARREPKPGQDPSMLVLIHPWTDEQLQTAVELGLARQRMVRQARSAQEEAAAAAPAAPSGPGLITVDARMRITFVNPEAVAITGWRSSEVVGRGLEEMVAFVDTASGTQWPNPVPAALQTQQVFRFPPSMRLRLNGAGALIYPECAMPMFDGEGRVSTAMIVVHPRAPGEAPAASQANPPALAHAFESLSLDYGNLLALALLRSGLVGDPSSAPRLLHQQEGALQALKQTAALASAVLEQARNGSAVEPEADLAEVVQDQRGLLQVGGIELRVELAPKLPRVRMDAGSLQLVVRNLFSNAREALAMGGTVVVAAEAQVPLAPPVPLPGQNAPRSSAMVRFTISDNGEGIRPEHLPEVQKAGFSTRTGRLGFGLSACRALVERWGGSLEVRSDFGHGTLVTVWLATAAVRPEPAAHTRPPFTQGAPGAPLLPPRPAYVPGPQPGAAPAAPAASPVHGYGPPAAAAALLPAGPALVPNRPDALVPTPSSGLSALVVDDEASVRSTLENMLKILGFRVRTGWDGAEGVRLYEEALRAGDPFSLVIVDLVIPLGMGGEQAVREFLRLDPNANVVLCSGFVDHEVVQNHRNYGFRAFLKKPLMLNDLRALLRNSGLTRK